MHLYAQHARSVHSIPVFGAEFQPTQSPDQSAFNGSLQSYSIEPTDDEMVLSRDLQEFMKFKQERIQELIDQKLSADPQKAQFSAELQLLKQFCEPDENDERITIFANSLMTPVYAEGLSNDNFLEMVEKCSLCCSPLPLLEVDGCLKKFFASISRSASGSSYINLPPPLQKCNSLLNIRNHTDNNYFIYSFVAASYLKTNDFEGEEGRNESSKLISPEFYQNMSSLQPAGEFAMPMAFVDIEKFETLNDVEVNVFGFENRDLFPMRVSKKSTSSLTLDELLLCESDKHHYVLIKDLTRFFWFIKNKKLRSPLHLCRNCLYLCHKDIKQFKDHIEVCGNNPPAVIRMPPTSNNLYKFNNWSATWFAPLVVYFDFESILKPVASCSACSESASTRSIEIRVPCGFAIAVIEQGNPQPNFSHLDSSVNCMQNFVQMVHKLAKHIHEQKRKYPFYHGDRSTLQKSETKKCWICESEFLENEKNLGHCHYTGNFLG